MPKYCTPKYNSVQDYNEFVYNDVDFYNEKNIKYISGFFDHLHREITLYGNTDKMSSILMVINHEINHGLITKVLNIANKDTLGSHLENYDHEYIARAMSNKLDRKILEKLIDFLERLD